MSLGEPAIVIVNAISSAGLGLTRGKDLFAGPLRPGKGRAVFAQATGGPPPQLMARGQAEIRTVQVQVWSAADEYEAGSALAEQILAAVHRREIGGYYHTEVREAGPVPIGRDDSDRIGFAFNVELHGLRR